MLPTPIKFELYYSTVWRAIVKRIITSLFYVASALLVMVLLAMSLMTVRVIPYEVRVVTTASMSPTILPYSVVLIRKGEYEVGQPIAFHTPNGVVTHRLIAVNTDGTLATKGDALTTIDPSFEPADKVIGGVKLIILGGMFWFLGLIALVVLLYALSRLVDTNEIEAATS